MSETDATNGHHPRVCPRCLYQRTPNEFAPDWQCPSCQIVYDKYQPPGHSGLPPSHHRNEIPTIGDASPFPWLALIFLALMLCGYYGYSYFRWPAPDQITLFTSNACGQPCELAVHWLTRQKEAFREINIDASETNRRRWSTVGGEGQVLPLAFFGRTRLEGFMEEGYKIALTGFLDRRDGDLNQTVIIYTRPGCPGCAKALDFFKKHKIAFEEYDITEPGNYNVYRELFGHGTPLLFIGNIRLDGFNDKALKMALEEVDLL